MADLADIASEQEMLNTRVALESRSRPTLGTMSAMECVACGEEIPEGSRRAIQGVQHCVECAGIFERRNKK